VTGQVALWCRRHGRKFVYSVANDTDCDSRLPEMHTLRERVLYRYGLKVADRVVVQTGRQREMLLSGFGCDSVIIPMPCPGPDDVEYSSWNRRRDSSQRVLWLARLCEQKRPDRLLDLAESCPEVGFDLVGPPADTEYARSVCQRAKSIPNVTFHGPVERENVPEYYKKAAIMCCTSDFEGFPNTFLEAWSYGLPIVSTFDPDNLIEEKKLGVVAQSTEGLASGIRAILGDSKRWHQASENAREYYSNNHTTDSVIPKFEKVFEEVMNSTENVDRVERKKIACQRL